MTFTRSVVPDVTESIPLDISRRIARATSFLQSGGLVDVAIGGLPFYLAISDDRPCDRETADFRKQQLDTSKEPGEQTLDQWWTRSQDSWHRGAGINFYDPGTDEGTQFRFKSSAGVDVWTKGEVSLLNSLSVVGAVSAGQSAYATTAVVGGTDCVFTNENGVVHRRTASTNIAFTGAALGPVSVAGAKILVGATDSIKSGDASGSAVNELWEDAPSVPTPYWCKSRIIASTANSLWELTLGGGTFTDETPIFVHPDTGWTWTAVTETPTAILAAGYSNGNGAIFKFTLEDAGSGTTPQLGQAYQVAEFPPGEEVYSIRVYLGQYIGIGTSRGLRVGVVDQDGNIQYGPLLVQTSAPVRALSARDSFIYAGVEAFIDGGSGVVRVNLAEPVDDSGLRFAWATDAQSHTTGQVDSVAFLGTTSRVVLGVKDNGVYLQSASAYEAEGYVESGALRFATTEPKAFRLAKIRGKAATGALSLLTVDTAGTQAFIFTLGESYDTNEDLALPVPVGPQPYLSIRTRLEAPDALDDTPILEGIQVKALPQVKRQRLMSYPLLCMDKETNRNGVSSSYEGFAADRLFALEALEDASAVVQVQDFTSGESFNAQIEKVAFRRTTAPSKAGPNFGGFLTVTVRRL
jgi:hypothetical protein